MLAAKIYIDALDVSRSYSFNQAMQHISKLVAGLKAAGLRKGDCVLVNSLADVGKRFIFGDWVQKAC